MRLISATLCTTVAAGLLVSCSGNGSSPNSAIPGGAAKISQAGRHGEILTTIPKSILLKTWNTKKFHGKNGPPAGKGLYVEQFFLTSNNILGYPHNNSTNQPPMCQLSTGSNVNDFGSDRAGNIIVPNAFSGVQLWVPPLAGGVCGTLVGTLTDSYGQASSAAALDAINGTIVVGNIGGGTTTGVVTCTTATGACIALISPGMSTLAGVAMDAAGNCYADAFDTSARVGLWYYAGCTGTGTELTSANGFNEPYYGGLSVDNKGNLVVVSLFNSSFTTPSTVTVYSGCSTSTCTVVSGPTALAGESIFGHLGHQNERWATTDITDSMVEVYSYSHGTLGSLLYSFNNMLTCATNLCESAVYQPGSPK